MTRAVALLLLVVPAAPAQDKLKEVTIRWHGQSFFQIESSRGTRVVIDPHQIEAYGRKSVPADLVLISHFHNDHTQLEAVPNAAKAKVLAGLRVNERTRRPDWNPLDETFKDIHVRSVNTYHDTTQGMERGKNAAFVLEVDGVRVVHLGDLGHQLTEADVKKIGPVDVLMIPVGGVYTLNGEEAKQVVAQLKPRQFIIPMHYGTLVYDDVLPVDTFLDGRKSVKRYPGNKLTTAAEFNPPQPVVAVLDWK
jgi:L-ascorbate metabolism protein UlaG (beta-lactamase superfamily)